MENRCWQGFQLSAYVSIIGESEEDSSGCWMLTLKYKEHPGQVKTTLIMRLWGIKIKPPSMPLFSENK